MKLLRISNIVLFALGIAVVWILIFGFEATPFQNNTGNKKHSESSNIQSESVVMTKKEKSATLELLSDKSDSAAEQKSSTPLVQKLKDITNSAVSALMYKTDKFSISEQIDVPIRGRLRVEFFDENTICIVGDYDAFLKDRFLEECGTFLRGATSPTANISDNAKQSLYDAFGSQIILKYRPVIARAYWNFSKFKISETKDPGKIAKSDKTSKVKNEDVTIKDGGYWLNPEGQAEFPDVRTGKPKLTQNAQVAHFAYLHLKTPLKGGKSYTVENPLGEKINFTFSDKSSRSGAIKVNQVGYSPEAGRKYAYVGGWLGTYGKLDISKYDNKPFEIIEEKTGKSVFNGILKKRGVSDATHSSGAKFSGEDVLEADFSSFDGNGTDGAYHLRIAGMGRSYSFEVSNDAIGEAFYIFAKGLYHKRCGIAKESPYTKWHMGKCHTTLYSSPYPPNDRYYLSISKNKEAGFFETDGTPVKVDHFRFIMTQEATAKKLDGEYSGGWHDAADYDRRPYHFGVVCDLASVYLLKPENFTDSQLNIPESGNGIPDILDEADWGMKIWLKLQEKSGAAGGWIEATSHPNDPNLSTDKQKYFKSASTIESSEDYAAHASMLALAFRESGCLERSKIYAESAERAHLFAINPANRFVHTYNYPKLEKEKKNSAGDAKTAVRKIIFRENPNLLPDIEFKTAFNLYLLTGKKKYLDECLLLESKMPQCFADTAWNRSPLFFAEFIKYGENSPLKNLFAICKKHMLGNAETRLEWLNNAYQYRIAWYPPYHHYVSNMSWGNFHPMKTAKFFIAASALTGDRKYRDAAFLCYDFHCGANPWGQSFTTGIGKNYPVKFLDLVSHSDEIAEYVQGITPYRNTFGIARDDIRLAHGLYYSSRGLKGYAPKPTMVLPPSITGDIGDSGELVPKIGDLADKLGKAWPIWHRFANIESLTVAASEYTVFETISPPFAVAGWLLKQGWKPTERLKNITPASDITKLGGYCPLP